MHLDQSRVLPLLLLLALVAHTTGCTTIDHAVTPAPVVVSLPAAALPTGTPPAGTYTGAQSVTLSDTTPGATIYYTTNGSTPTTASTLYTGPVVVSASETINAIAVATGYNTSSVATATYVIDLLQAAAPTFTPPAGTYTGTQTVTISDTTSGATIYYTTNGTTPTASSTLYTGPIAVSTSETINAIAVATGYSTSSVATAAYVIDLPQAAAPTFSPPAGTYTSTQTVSISDTTPGATIYYTTNGTTPTPSSTLYIGPITVAISETINAIAVASGYSNSPVATAVYVIQQSAYNCGGTGPGIICTIAGDGTHGYNGDGITAVDAELWAPYGLTVDSSGNVYIADSKNSRVRKVTPAGIISTVAGNGTTGFSGDNGSAVNAELDEPAYLVFDASGNLYIADIPLNRVRKVTPAGIITTFAGTGAGGFSGDSGPATSATLDAPNGLAFDSSGNLYIADSGNERVRMVTPAGIISTVAGSGVTGFGGDGGSATAAELAEPVGVAIDSTGNLYIDDFANNRIRKVTRGGIISTIAGTGVAGYSGDGGAASAAELNDPEGIAVDINGDLMISDGSNNRIRKVNPSGIISTVAGNGSAGFTGDGGLATSAELDLPFGVAGDLAGNLYISDLANNRIREVYNSTVTTPTFTPPAGIYTTVQTVTIASTTPGTTIYYTTDGSTPTTASTVYSGPITVSVSETLNAIAVAPGYTASPVATAAYSIQTVIASRSNLTVLGTSIVMDPDNVFSSTMLSQFGGTPATLAFQFAAQPGLSVTLSATGKIACCTTIDIGPDGQSGSFTMPSVGSISGFTNPTGWPLVGVFTNGDPTGSAPAAYNYTVAGDSQLSYSPVLNQIFFIGDGLTGTGTGSVQTFNVPAGATELWLGIADVSGTGTPGSYGDNPGSFTVSATLR